MYDLVVVGGGAAGFFGAIQTAEMRRGFSILILEKTTKLLSKVRVSGGGRCNVTHHCFEVKKLAAHYPRGEKALREAFKLFAAEEVIAWFEKKGVRLKTEEDGRMFPVSNDSQTIVDLFLQEARHYGIEIKLSACVSGIKRQGSILVISCEDGSQVKSKKVLIAMGGHANNSAYTWLKELGHSIKSPIPSLFTFNDAHKDFKELMGVSVPEAFVRITGTKYTQQGPLLITHWGLSGPAIIKLSAWAAQYLHDVHYQFTVLVSWIGDWKEEKLREQLVAFKNEIGKQKIVTNAKFGLPQRLWYLLCQRAGIEETKIWNEISLKSLNKLLENLLRCEFEIKGKTTFKEEFVTCGGIPLNEIDLKTMESILTPSVYFAGEVLDIDGETGGFNFQAAWTTAFIAASTLTKD